MLKGMDTTQSGVDTHTPITGPNGSSHEDERGAYAAEKTSVELYFEAQSRAKDLRESAIKELLAERERHLMSVEQITQQLVAAGYNEMPTVVIGAQEDEPPVKHRGRPSKAVVAKEASPLLSPPAPAKKKKFSAETLEKMRESQKKRWQKARKAQAK